MPEFTDDEINALQQAFDSAHLNPASYGAITQRLADQQAEAARVAGQNTGAVGDVITSFEQALYSTPRAVTSIADIPVAAVTGYQPFSAAMDAFYGLPFTPNFDQWAADQEAEYTDEFRRQRAEVEKAEGLDVVGALLQNPRVLAGDIAGSLPYMLAGGALGAGVRAAAAKAGAEMGGLAAAGIGEGAIMAGASMDEMTEAGVDPRLAALLSSTVGAVGAGIGVAGGSLARRAGVEDPEVFLQKFAETGVTKSVGEETSLDVLERLAKQATDTTGKQRLAAGAARVGIGGALEGAEEFGQSATEAVAMNLGTGEDAGEGVLTQALRGAVSGVGMGGLTNIGAEGRAELRRRQARDVIAPAMEALDTLEARQEAEIAARDAIKGTKGVGPAMVKKLGSLWDYKTVEDIEEHIDTVFPPTKTGKQSAQNKRVKEALYETAYYKSLPNREELAEQNSAEQRAAEQQAAADAAEDNVANQTKVTTEEEDDPDVLKYTEEDSPYESFEAAAEALRAAGHGLAPEVEKELQQKPPGQARVVSDKESSDRPSRGTAEKPLAEVAREPRGKKSKLTPRSTEGLAMLLSGFTDDYMEKAKKHVLGKTRTEARSFKKRLAGMFPNMLYPSNGQVTKTFDKQDPKHAKILREIRKLKFPTTEVLGVEGKEEGADARVIAQEKARLTRLMTAVNNAPPEVWDGKQKRALLTVLGTHYRAYNTGPVSSDKANYDRTMRMLGLTDPASSKDGAKLVSLVESLQENLRIYDKLVALAGASRPVQMRNMGKFGRVTGKAKKIGGKEPKPTDLIPPGYTPETQEEAAAIASIAAEEDRAIEATLRGESLAVAEDFGDEGSVLGLQQYADAITSQITELKELVGLDNLNAALRRNKESLKETTEVGRKTKQGNEKSSAVLFSRFFNLYKRDGEITPWSSIYEYRRLDEGYEKDGTRIEERPLDGSRPDLDYASDRIVTLSPNGRSKAERYDGTRANQPPKEKPEIDPATGRVKKGTKLPKGDPYQPPLQMETIINEAREKYKGESNPVMLMLKHIQHTSSSPMSRVLARSLQGILGAGDRTFVDKIELKLYGQLPTDSVEIGKRRRGRYIHRSDGTSTIELYGEWQPNKTATKRAHGMSEETFLHEVLHAASDGVISTPLNKLKPAQRAAVKQMRAVAAMADEFLTEDLNRAYENNDEEQIRLLNIIRAHMGGGKGKPIDVGEFLSVALTSPYAGQWLNTITGSRVRRAKGYKALQEVRAAAKSLKGRPLETLWTMFRTALKSMVAATTVSDSFFNEVADASASILGQVFVDAHEDQMVFSPRPTAAKTTPATKGRRKKVPLELVRRDSVVDLNDVDDNSVEVQERTAIAARELRDKTNEERARAAVNEEALKEARAKRQEAFTASDQQKQTVVDPTSKRDSKVFFISRLEQGVFDGVVRILSNGRFKTYRQMVEAGFDFIGDKINKFVRDPGNKHDFWSSVVGAALSSVVDQFGLPEAYKGITHEAEAASGGHVSFATFFYDGFRKRPAEVQDALAEYAMTPPEEKAAVMQQIKNRLYKTLPKDISDQAVKDVSKAVTGMEENLQKLYDTAVRLGVVTGVDADLPLHEFLNRYVDLHQRGGIVANPRVSVGKLQRADVEKNFEVDKLVGSNQIVDRTGGFLPDSHGDTKFYRLVSTDPKRIKDREAIVYIAVDAPKAVWDKYQAGPTANKSVYSLVPDKDGIPRMMRRRTPQEIRQQLKLDKETRGRGTAQASAGLANLMQDLGRRVEGAKAVAHMEAINKDIKNEDEKWFIDPVPRPSGLPEGADHDPRPEVLLGLPEAMVINPREEGDYKAGFAEGFIGWRRRARRPGTWVLVPDDDEGKKIFGSLAGRYVAGPIYSSIMDYHDTKPVIPSSLYRHTLRMWKKNKTVYSPAAHLNNITSNFVLAYIYDLPVENLQVAFVAIMSEMYPEGMKKWVDKIERKPQYGKGYISDLLKEKAEVGITLGQMKSADLDFDTEQEMKTLLDDMFSDKQDGTPRSLIGKFFAFSRVQSALLSSSAKLRDGMEQANNMYSNQDNIFRLAAYMKHLQEYAEHKDSNGKTVKGIGPDGRITIESRRAAAQAANRAFVDYRVHAPLIRGLRDTATPFITWTYRMVPLLTKTAIMKPWKVANLVAGVYAINAIGYALAGGDEDDERGLLPSYMQNNMWGDWHPVDVPTTIRLPFSLGSEMPHFLNIGRMVPLGDLTQENNSGTPQTLAFGGPLSILYNLNTNNDPFTGRPIADENLSWRDWYWDKTKYLAGAFLPGVAVASGKAIDKTGLGPFNDEAYQPLGTPYSPWTQAAKVLGLNVYHMDLNEAAYAKDQETEFIERKFKTTISRLWKEELRGENPDPDAAAKRELELLEAMDEAIREARNLE